MGFKCGIVGLPNVGKSTLFNALTASKNAEAANFPFCTIDPNIGIVDVIDERLDKLSKLSNSKSEGEAICIIPKCELYPGHYIYTVTCLVNGYKSDKIYDAGTFTIDDGKYYNSGLLPAQKNCIVVTDHYWKIS